MGVARENIMTQWVNSIRGEVGGARGVEWVWLASVVVKAQTDREGGNGPKESVDLGNR